MVGAPSNSKVLGALLKGSLSQIKIFLSKMATIILELARAQRARLTVSFSCDFSQVRKTKNKT